MTLTKLRGAEYLIRSVADGVEDYFMGAGEAPGVWHGRWADRLGLAGVVEPDQLRALVDGQHPTLGFPLLSGHRQRVVKALDFTLSAPKSVSLLWAFADPATTAEVSLAVSAAATTAVDFLEAHAAVARRQVGGRRRRVGTHGFAVAMFTHRTSRAGDPQLHVHCLVPNVVERDDGVHVAIDAGPAHEWLKASGTVFQAELQRQLTERLGIAWGPERNGCRELVGFDRAQLRAFSKRTVAIETVLEAGPEAVTARERMKADDRASIATRDRKDRTLTPEALRGRWQDEATRAGIPRGRRLLRTLRHQTARDVTVDRSQVFTALTDPASGLCATNARFGHAHVVERVAALANGRWTTTEIETLASELLATDLVVRLSGTDRRRPAQWSTTEHRQLEDRVLADLAQLQARPAAGVEVSTSLAEHLGEDQSAAARVLCAPGPALRVILAPAGHGKTSLTAAAAATVEADGRPVIALAATNKAAAELRTVGLGASTIARWRLDGAALAPGTVVVLDEISQVSTRDAAAVLAAVTITPGAALWCLGDDHQGRSVAPGGLAAELARLADEGQVAAAALTVNRRQHDPDERTALATYRAGDLAGSQATRAERDWEHTAPTPEATRNQLADAAVIDICDRGPDAVTVLAVSHTDCEDLADRIRQRLGTVGRIGGPEVAGPGWGINERRYATGDRVLLHLNCRLGDDRVHNGTTGSVTAVNADGLRVRLDDGRVAVLPPAIYAGTRSDGTPNLSHAWARTIDGAQGGTWDHVHLLATPNVDRYTLYVGQSRGRYPTHTWNTIPGRDDETHGNVVIDPRTPDEIVLAAAHRSPEHTFAARDDPNVLDGRLRAERDEHHAALAAGPPDRRIERGQLAHRVDQLEHDAGTAADALKRADREVRATGGPHLRRRTRDAHRRAIAARDRAEAWLTDTQDDLRVTRAQLCAADSAVEQHRRWEIANRWRHDEVARLDHELDRHWTRTVLAAIDQDDPLAHGLDHLRQARRFLAAKPDHDRSSDLSAVEHALTKARLERLHAVVRGVPTPEHLTALLGPLPEHPAARDTWRGLALEAETRIDSGDRLPPHQRPHDVAGRLADLGPRDPLCHARLVIAAAHELRTPVGLDTPERWQHTVEAATEMRRRIERPRTRELDHGLGISL